MAGANHRYEIVRVVPEELACPSCGSRDAGGIYRMDGTAAPRPWWAFWRPAERAQSCGICKRTDTHYHLCCKVCGRIWDIG